MKKLLHSLAAIAIFSVGVLSATDVLAQACLNIGAKSGDQVRLNFGSVSAFWFQELDLTVKSFTEFAELQTNPGGSFCGAVRVQIAGSLVPGGMGQNEIILFADTALKPGTRLHLDEFISSNNFFSCLYVGPSETCMWNGDLFRSATVSNR